MTGDRIHETVGIREMRPVGLLSGAFCHTYVPLRARVRDVAVYGIQLC